MMQVSDVLAHTGAVLLNGDAKRWVHGVSTDTRTLRPHQLYFALSGPNFDGNQFAPQASAMGAGALLLRAGSSVDRRQLGDTPVVLHDEPRRALTDLAAWHRSTLSIPVIGITGSCGKTSTKNILAQLLATRLRTVASPNSFNNDVGVPHTVMLADHTTQALVVEIGTNAPGEIAALCEIARPTCGVVTNIGASHLEGLGSILGVAREKSALFASLPEDGFAVLNLDARHADLLRAATRARIVTISVDGEGDLNASEPFFHSGGATFRLLGYEVTSPLLGVHNISNLLSALGVCVGLGIDVEELLPAICELKTGGRRMERHELDGLVVFDDTYNANPESARAAVRVLAGLHGAGRRVLVLGDMLELGPDSPEMHHAIGADAARAGLDLIVLVGELTRATAAGALEAGMPASRVVHLDSLEQALARIEELLEPRDTVLFKASRRSALDRVVEHLKQRHARVGA
jgi:UDP-N-acetylmuramoyl-tripeptide--D-alanyl-D-alanine ligase